MNLDKEKLTALAIIAENGVALIKAAEEGELDVVKTILQNPNVNINFQNLLRRDTALIAASEMGYLNIIKTLLLAGADPTLVNSKGKTAYDKCHGGRTMKECKEILKEAVKNYDRQHYRRLKKEETPNLVTAAAPKLPILPKEVWQTILKQRLQSELCADLYDTNTEMLLVMAKEDFGVPEQVIEEWRQRKSKSNICDIVSGLLSIGAMYSEKAMDYLKEKEKLQTVAMYNEEEEYINMEKLNEQLQIMRQKQKELLTDNTNFFRNTDFLSKYGKKELIAKALISFRESLKKYGIEESYYNADTGEERQKPLKQLINELAIAQRFYRD